MNLYENEKFKVHEPQYKNGASQDRKTSAQNADENGFVNVSSGEEEIPF